MVTGLFLIQLLLCAAILHREVWQLQFRNLATSVFYGVYLIVFVIEPLVLQVFFGGARSINPGVPTYFSDPYIYYLFNCYGIALLTTSLFLRRAPVPPQDPVSGASADQVAATEFTTYIALLIVAGVALFIYSTGMSLPDLVIASRFAWFAEGSFSLFWLTVSSYFIALVGLYAYLVKISEKPNWLLAAICIGAIIFNGVVTKDRKWVIFLASGWLAGHYEVSGRRLAIKRRAVIMFAALFVVLVISQFLRDVLFRIALGEEISFVREIARWQSFLIEYGDISYFYRASLEAIHQNVNNHFIVPFALARRIAFFFLPARFSAGLKVEDISATFSDLVDGGDALRRGNQPPGLFGLFVISFGWLASLFLIPLLALLLRRLDALFTAGAGMFRRVVLALFVFATVLAFRGDESSAVYYIISTYLFILVARVIWRPSLRLVNTADSRVASPNTDRA